MQIKRLGIEWGAAHDEAQPTLIRSRYNDEVLIYVMEGGGFGIEVQGQVKVAKAISTKPSQKGQPTLVVYTK